MEKLDLSQLAGVGFGILFGTVPLLVAAAEKWIANYFRAGLVAVIVGVVAFSAMAPSLRFDDAAGLAMWITVTLGCGAGGIIDNVLAARRHLH